MSRSFSQKILISTNSSCNLKCIYCFEKNKSNYTFDVSKAISIIEKLLSSKSELGTKIKIHGGEPFLVFNKLKQLCECLWAKNYPEYYEFHITTNGTLIHGKIQDWLRNNKEKIRLKLSIDGDKLSNDINRPCSFEKIDFPFLVRTYPNIVASMTITPQTLRYFFENIKFLHRSGFKNIVFQFSLMTNWSKCDLQKIFYQQMSLLIDYYIKNPNITPCFSWIKIEKTLNVFAKPLCGIGHMKAFDFQSNQFYPCQMCFPSVCGDTLSSKLQKIDFTSPDILADGPCRNCSFVNLCTTCYAENYITRGSASNRDLSICSYQEILYASIFRYEYERILKIENPTSSDIRKMTAIQKHYKKVESILSNIKVISKG